MLWIWPYLLGVFTLTVTAEVPGKFNVSVPHGPITSPLGSSVILPCAVTPSFSVLPYKVLWQRPDTEKTTVLHFEQRKIQEKSADPQYRGRASLVGDLEMGNVSLKLENLTLADRGGYVCMVNSFIWYDKAEQDLHVRGMYFKILKLLKM
ncbi:myelin-oligodendrocyte glycoprotein-like, partial [Engraulis encrasicolus]|uniref:myelin-oligodendrocyte glycoprotein-like n=1 Tax=Engraulis encrasicolus TaxID=184585 RepID=UPI002FD30501